MRDTSHQESIWERTVEYELLWVACVSKTARIHEQLRNVVVGQPATKTIVRKIDMRWFHSWKTIFPVLEMSDLCCERMSNRYWQARIDKQTTEALITEHVSAFQNKKIKTISKPAVTAPVRFSPHFVCYHREKIKHERHSTKMRVFGV